MLGNSKKTAQLKIPADIEDKEAAEALLKIYIAWTRDAPSTNTKVAKNMASKDIELDSRSFIKMLKQAHLIPQAFCQKDADMAFIQAKEKSAKLTFPMFLFAMYTLADKNDSQIRDYLGNLVEFSGSGPQYSNLSAESMKGVKATSGPAKFYYDKKGWTGAHKAGGPSTMDAGEAYRGGFSALISRDAIQDDALQRKKFGGIVEKGGSNRKNVEATTNNPGLRKPMNFKPESRVKLDQAREKKTQLKAALAGIHSDTVKTRVSSRRDGGEDEADDGKTSKFSVKYKPDEAAISKNAPQSGQLESGVNANEVK